MHVYTELQGHAWIGDKWTANLDSWAAQSSPDIAKVGKSVMVTAEDYNNDLEVYQQTLGQPNSFWNQDDTAQSIGSSPSIAQVGQSADVDAEGPSNDLVFQWQAIGSTSWNYEQVDSAQSTYG